MVSEWTEVSFGDIFDITSSKRVLQRDWQKEGIPFYRAREIVKLAKDGAVDNDLFITEDLFDDYAKKYGAPEPGDLMVSAVGTLGACYQVKPSDKFYFKDASVLKFRPKKPVFARYIEHAFKSQELIDQIQSGSGSTVGTLTISRAKEMSLLLPPLDEQKRIAAILDQADALRRLRQRAIDRLNTLGQAIFHEMFGDPYANTWGLPTENLGEICDVRDGTHDSPKYVEEGYPLLTSKNFTSGDISLDGAKLISKADFDAVNKRSKVDVGDIVMPMIGTIGHPVIIKEEPRFAIKNVALIKFKDELVRASYIHALLSGSFLKRIVSQKNRGGTQKFISLGDIRGMEIPLPSRADQLEFERRVNELGENRVKLLASAQAFESLFSSLQHRAFRGEL